MEYLTRSVQSYGILLANVSRAGEDPAEYMGLGFLLMEVFKSYFPRDRDPSELLNN